MLSMETIIIFLLLGTAIGIISGLFGIGGGGIIVPILTGIFLSNGVSETSVVHIALGTSMGIMAITSFSTSLSQHKRGAIVWSIFKAMVPGIMIGTFLATFIATHLSSFLLALFFSIFMFASSLHMFFGKVPSSKKPFFSNKVQFFSGGGIGIISALVSIAGGIITVPYLVMQNIDIKKAIGTSSAIGFVLALSGTLGYFVNGLHLGFDETSMTLGYISIPALFIVAITSFLFAPLGVKLSHKIKVGTLKKLFSALPFILSIKMMLSLV